MANININTKKSLNRVQLMKENGSNFEYLYIDLAGDGVHVLAVHPGWVKTQMGGEGAVVEADECAVTLLETLDRLPAGTSGQFLSYDGKPLTW
jgi:phage replication-related protein YjqB (UPF0714/DUF867 family)